jgi:hypothetical protein
VAKPVVFQVKVRVVEFPLDRVTSVNLAMTVSLAYKVTLKVSV